MISTLVLDIESTALYADEGVVLCVCYESSTMPGKVKVLRNDEIAKKDWAQGRRGNDRELVKQTNDIIRDHDIIVAHNGKGFDLPFMRTRALKWGLTPLMEPKTVDPLLIALRKYRLKRNRLGSLSDLMGIPERKTPLEMSTWADAMLNGSKAAMDQIVEHCVADVKVLSAVLKKVKPYTRVFDDRGSAL